MEETMETGGTDLAVRVQIKGSKRIAQGNKENPTHIFHWAKWGSAVWTHEWSLTVRRKVMRGGGGVGCTEMPVVLGWWWGWRPDRWLQRLLWPASGHLFQDGLTHNSVFLAPHELCSWALTSVSSHPHQDPYLSCLVICPKQGQKWDKSVTAIWSDAIFRLQDQSTACWKHTGIDIKGLLFFPPKLSHAFPRHVATCARAHADNRNDNRGVSTQLLMNGTLWSWNKQHCDASVTKHKLCYFKGLTKNQTFHISGIYIGTAGCSGLVCSFIWCCQILLKMSGMMQAQGILF